MARLDKNWTAVNELEHWAWEAAEHAQQQWLASLPEDHPVHDMDLTDRFDQFVWAHPQGWAPHPDCPRGLDGTHVRDLRIETV